MTRVTVLGAGLVGSLIARTLADDGRFEVLVCDRSEDALGFFAGRPRVATARLDFASRPRSRRPSLPRTSSSARCPGSSGTRCSGR